MDEAYYYDKVAELRFKIVEQLSRSWAEVRRSNTARDLQVAAYGLKSHAEALHQEAIKLNGEAKP